MWGGGGLPNASSRTQLEKGRPNSQVAGRVAMRVLLSNKPLTQMSS